MTNYNWIISLRRIIHATNCPATNCPATNRPCNELSVRRIVRRRIVLQRIVHATNCPQRIVRDELSCNELSGHPYENFVIQIFLNYFMLTRKISVNKKKKVLNIAFFIVLYFVFQINFIKKFIWTNRFHWFDNTH
jgi:hypothetical protein